jgi:hypothetical protein
MLDGEGIMAASQKFPQQQSNQVFRLVSYTAIPALTGKVKRKPTRCLKAI